MTISEKNETVFYHIYPLGFCDAPEKNDYYSPSVPRLSKIESWIEHFTKLGINTLYIGPLFESESHGYDTVDYYHIDRRLGNNDILRSLVERLHHSGIRVILDAVFNHSSRYFFAFQDILKNKANSQYTNWYADLNFSGNNCYNDGFSYEGWASCLNLVKYNLHNPEIKEHLINAALQWIKEFDIDGLRLDAADVIDLGFLKELSERCKKQKQNFWLMGEVVHGDYNRWIRDARLDSVTNYEAYKGMWSSFNDGNFFEIAYSLNRQFGENGIYRQFQLYNFLDNHDVNRIASTLHDPKHLELVYGLLFTIPGIPSIYYGSEFGIQGKKDGGNDRQLRPALDMNTHQETSLTAWISQLAKIRKLSPALCTGDYSEQFTASKQFAFVRQCPEEKIMIVFNSSPNRSILNLQRKRVTEEYGYDLLSGTSISVNSIELKPYSMRIIKF